MNYVIIGNSAAAVGTIEGIRQIDKTGKITVISDEKYHTYSRPLISYWLMGKVTDKNIYYRSPDFYEKNGVETMLGCRAAKIDSVKPRYLLTDDPVLIPGTGELIMSDAIKDYRIPIIEDNSLLRIMSDESIYLCMLVRDRIQREKMEYKEEEAEYEY